MSDGLGAAKVYGPTQNLDAEGNVIYPAKRVGGQQDLSNFRNDPRDDFLGSDSSKHIRDNSGSFKGASGRSRKKDIKSLIGTCSHLSAKEVGSALSRIRQSGELNWCRHARCP